MERSRMVSLPNRLLGRTICQQRENGVIAAGVWWDFECGGDAYPLRNCAKILVVDFSCKYEHHYQYWFHHFMISARQREGLLTVYWRAGMPFICKNEK
jgi:hypothetical protein